MSWPEWPRVAMEHHGTSGMFTQEVHIAIRPFKWLLWLLDTETPPSLEKKIEKTVVGHQNIIKKKPYGFV